MLRSRDRIVADAPNLAGAPNLQFSNSRQTLPFSSMNLMLSTLIEHNQVNDISNFQYDKLVLMHDRDLALQSCKK